MDMGVGIGDASIGDYVLVRVVFADGARPRSSLANVPDTHQSQRVFQRCAVTLPTSIGSCVADAEVNQIEEIAMPADMNVMEPGQRITGGECAVHVARHHSGPKPATKMKI
ncbi:MAG: hypothetical protein IT445_15325 [Phycisphaeraceae bacterium]|nr:hypothetical protein [Phycisphaeraceae bacterium]